MERTEKLLKEIVEELKNISSAESDGPDGNVLFGKLDDIIDGIAESNETLKEISSKIDSLEFAVREISVE